MDKTFYTATTSGRSDSLIFACALGYNYTDNTKISIGPIVSLPVLAAKESRMGVMTGLFYRHNIKDMSIAPYVNTNLGVLSGGLSNYNFAYRISSGADLLFSAKASFYVGYYLEKGISQLNHLHGPEVGVNFYF